jgi:PAS domain S-box-containing protein
MKRTKSANDQLRRENEDLRRRLQEAEDALAAISSGHVDAIVVDGTEGAQIFSLNGTETVYRLAVETMAEATMNVTPDGVILFSNARLAEFVATPLEKILGRNLAEFIPIANRDSFRTLLAQCVRQPVKERVVFRAVDGTLTPTHLSGHAVTQGDQVSLCLVAADLTELEGSAHQIEHLRKAKAALRDLAATLEQRVAERTAELVKAGEAIKLERQRLFDVLETLPAMVCLLTPEHQIAFANRAFRAMFGELDGQHCYEQCFGLSKPCGFCETFKVLETGQPHHWEVAGPDGRVIDVYDFPFTDTDGTPLILVMDIDITEWRRNEAALTERTAEVERQACQLRALASQLSQAEQRERKRLAKILHDHIQQLIVAAHMQVEWLKHDTNPERLMATAQGVESILQEALDASRSLTVELSPPVLHETGLIGGLNWLVSRMLEQHHFAVRLRADSKAEPLAEEMRLLLFECVRELLLNAVKHAGVREADVVLMRPGDGEIKVIVRDQGKGFNLDVVVKRRPEQISFGLFSIQERLAHLGGRMDIETAPGRGTQVTVVAPVAEEERPAATSGEAAGVGPETTVRVQRRPEACRVVIVDDHQIVREGLARLFEFESDIEVVGQAADGPEAIALAEKLEPDVVLMDVNLGEMDGVAATRRILARDPDIKVIGLSMHIDKSVANAMRDAGAVAYVTKGGPSQNLIEAIRTCHRI